MYILSGTLRPSPVSWEHKRACSLWHISQLFRHHLNGFLPISLALLRTIEVSGGQHFPSLNLDPYQWTPETSFLFVFPMLKLFQAFSDGWSFYSWLILVETEEPSVWTALGPAREEAPSAAIFRPSCVWERVARFRTRLFVYSYRTIHKLWYCLPLWCSKAFT